MKGGEGNEEPEEAIKHHYGNSGFLHSYARVRGREQGNQGEMSEMRSRFYCGRRDKKYSALNRYFPHWEIFRRGFLREGDNDEKIPQLQRCRGVHV